MRVGTVLVFAASVVLAVLTFTVIHLLCNLEPEALDPSVTTAHLVSGELWRLYVAPRTWQLVPTAIGSLGGSAEIAALFGWRALLTTALIGATSFVWWRQRACRDRATLGVLCVGGAACTWAIGAAWLMQNSDPAAAGPTIGWMVVTLFWACVLCAGACAWGWFGRALPAAA